MELSLSVSPSQAGRPLKSVMRNELCVSAAALRRLKAAGALYVNGAPVYANYVLSEGDLVTVPLDLAEEFEDALAVQPARDPCAIAGRVDGRKV